MAQATYEVLFLLDPNKASSDLEGVMNSVNGLIERQGGRIIDSRPWNDQYRLAYPIGKFRKGSYVLTYFESNTQSIPEFERDCRLHDAILRHMVVRLHPKIAGEVLTQLQSGPPEEEQPSDSEGGRERGDRKGDRRDRGERGERRERRPRDDEDKTNETAESPAEPAANEA